MHRIYCTPEEIEYVSQGCRTAGIGCLDCNKPLIDAVVTQVSAIRARAQEFEESPALVRGIVDEGCEKARETARRTMTDVRESIGLEYR